MKILFKNNCKKAGENNSKKIFKKFQKNQKKILKKYEKIPKKSVFC